jgi:tagatose-1,6-bisphosphate aldolase
MFDINLYNIMGIVIIISILLILLYIYVQRLNAYNNSQVAAVRIIAASDRSDELLQIIQASSKAAIATDNPNDSNNAATKAIAAYNELAVILDKCKVDFLKIKNPEFKSKASTAIDHIQAQLAEGKAILDTAVKYVTSLPNTVFSMAKCPVPCYAANPK